MSAENGFRTLTMVAPTSPGKPPRAT